MLLQLPRELRDQIYIRLFESTKLSYGKRRLDDQNSEEVTPLPNSLAILRVCRQINQESNELWLPHITFHFARPIDMVKKLSTLPVSIVSKIRYLETTTETIRVPESDLSHLPGLPSALFFRFIPTLNLSRLTVIGTNNRWQISYTNGDHEDLEAFIVNGNGWRELHFISSCPEITVYPGRGNDDHPGGRIPGQPYSQAQLSAWETLILERDGGGSGSSVRVHSSADGHFGVRCNHDGANLAELPAHPILPHPLFCAVVKRGRDVDIRETFQPSQVKMQEIQFWLD